MGVLYKGLNLCSSDSGKILISFLPDWPLRTKYSSHLQLPLILVGHCVSVLLSGRCKNHDTCVEECKISHEFVTNKTLQS